MRARRRVVALAPWRLARRGAPLAACSRAHGAQTFSPITWLMSDSTVDSFFSRAFSSLVAIEDSSSFTFESLSAGMAHAVVVVGAPPRRSTREV